MLQYLLVTCLVLSILYLLSFFFTNLYSTSGHNNNQALSIYENGFEPIGDSLMKMDLYYWFIGLIYLIFDLELIFILPFISIYLYFNSFFILIVFIVFVLILG